MYIKDLRLNDQLDDIFYIVTVSRNVSTSNKPYASLVLQDKTGTVDAKKWDLSLQDEEILKAGNFIHVEGIVQEFNNKPQFRLSACSLIDPSKLNKADFMNSSPVPIKDLEKKLDYYLSLITKTNLHSLTKTIIDKRRGLFLNGVAATKIHHDFIGGLVFHTVSMCGLADKIVDHLNETYPDNPVDKSLLIAGCLLHDIGKIEEIEVDTVSKYTTKGHLIGHISLGFSIISETAKSMNLQGDEDVILLQHMVLSHHGKHEYGSPVLPMFKEAFLLSMIDDMDSKANFIDKAYDDLNKGEFSKNQFAFDNRPIYKPKK